MLDMAPKKSETFRLDPDLMAKVQAWANKQPATPSKTAVIEAALEEFLAKYDNDDSNSKPDA